MSAIVFRTVYGGPNPAAVTAATVIKRELRNVDLSYELDIFLHVGGAISSIEGPSGLYAPRVSVAQRRMTAQIRINRADVLDAPDLSRFLRQTIHVALQQMIERIAARDKTVDADDEIRKLAFLVES
ncbi:hypothetical protein C8K36_102189 [Rhodococcus sp. OK519]|uniref:hypothetical protein n=1 Tax=Rhodococcus sp. OK519 TaxID=2135729 RepID=UPI000D3B3AD3|nr:hypothetical protein C8K36_102189 [Rhodococcus sp. OK519]